MTNFNSSDLGILSSQLRDIIDGIKNGSVTSGATAANQLLEIAAIQSLNSPFYIIGQDSVATIMYQEILTNDTTGAITFQYRDIQTFSVVVPVGTFTTIAGLTQTSIAQLSIGQPIPVIDNVGTHMIMTWRINQTTGAKTIIYETTAGVTVVPVLPVVVETAAIEGMVSSMLSNQTNGTQKAGIWQGGNQLAIDGSGRITTNSNTRDGSGAAINSTTNALWVNVQNPSLAVTGTFWQATQPISAVSLPLPTGASTATLQTTGNTSLGNIDTAQGAKADAIATDTGSWSVISILKGIWNFLNNTLLTKTKTIAAQSNTDQASAAQTVSGQTAAILNDGSFQSVSFVIDVTVVSGTTPTMDLILEESFDNGSTFNTIDGQIYHVERITAAATGTSKITIPKLALRGNAYRWRWVIGGTTPSFTFSITSLRDFQKGKIIRRFFDRTVTLGTAGSNGATFNISGTTLICLSCVCSALTVAGTIGIQFSDDNTNWSTLIGANNITVVNGTVRSTAFAVMGAKFCRIRVNTASTGATLIFTSILATE